jgi:lipoate-protein ligase A
MGAGGEADRPLDAPRGGAGVARTFRVVDTGVREGRRHIALDQAMIDARNAGAIPDTIRFLRFPPTVLVGRHQALSREVRLDYCREHGIGVGRRITGGGAIYFDEGQLGWELVFARKTIAIGTLPELAREICEAAALGLRRLGVDARYRPRNDIEVGGRKVSGTGGFFDGDTLFYQGTVLIDLDPARMVSALRVAEAKLAKRALDSAAQRVVTLQQLLGAAPPMADVQQALLEGFAERLGITPAPGALTAHEEALAARYYADEIGTDAFVAGIDDPGGGEAMGSASVTGAGGTVTAYVRLDGMGEARVRDALVTGDFFVTPPRIVFDLESSLRGVPARQVGDAVERFFAPARVGLLSVSTDDFRRALEGAAEDALRTPGGAAAASGDRPADATPGATT